VDGGEGGIRTPGTLPGTVVFKTTAIDHSATSPINIYWPVAKYACSSRLGVGFAHWAFSATPGATSLGLLTMVTDHSGSIDTGGRLGSFTSMVPCITHKAITVQT
jgi:hypothetical protein